MRRDLVLVLALLGACWTSSPRPDPAGTGTTSTSPVGTAPPAGARCAATLGAVRGACSSEGPCTYGDVTCTCVHPQWCGGMAPPETFYQSPGRWSCKKPPGPTECPASEPENGAACAVEGKRCDYTCSCLLDATCTNHRWVVRAGACKP